MEWNPRALLVTFAAAAGLWLFVSYGRSPAGGVEADGSAAPHPWLAAPDVTVAPDPAELAARLGAVGGYDYDDGGTPMRVLVFEERPGWHTLVFYVGDGSSFSRVAGTYHPTGFQAPRLVGAPPMLAFHSVEMGVDFAYRLRGGQMELAALGDARLGPERPAEEADDDLPGMTVQGVFRDEDAP